MRKGIILFIAAALATSILLGQSARPSQVQFIFTSDSHYGLTRSFHGLANVSAHIVNAALVSQINKLPAATFPADGGIRSAQPVGPIDFVVDGGERRGPSVAPSVLFVETQARRRPTPARP